jgi:hypothetical protein
LKGLAVANAGTLTVTLQAVASKFTAGMSKASKSLSMFRGAIGPVQAALGGLSATLVAGRFVQVASNLDTLADSAAKLGVSIKDLSGLQYAGVVKGIANDELSGALDRLNRASTMAADGNKRYGASFSKLGIDLGSFTKLDAEQKMFAFSDALAKIEDPAQRSAIAIRLLGNNSADMMDLLGGGSAGLQALQAEADTLGISVGSSAADLGKFNEEMAKLGSMWKAAEMQIVIALAPGVMDALTMIRDVAAIMNGGDVSRVEGSQGAIGPESYRGGSITGDTEQAAASSRFGSLGGLGYYFGRDDSAGALSPAEQAAQDARAARNKSPAAEQAFKKEIDNAATRQAVAGMLGGAFESLKGKAGGMIANAQQMGAGGASAMGSLGGWYQKSIEMQNAGAANMRGRKDELMGHFGKQRGENNLLKRGTREAWMAERKGSEEKEQINLLKGIEKACVELAKKGVTVATLD